MSPENELTITVRNLMYRIDAINDDNTGLYVSLAIFSPFAIVSLFTAVISAPLSLAWVVTGGILVMLFTGYWLRQKSKEKHRIQRQINKLTGKPEDYTPLFL